MAMISRQQVYALFLIPDIEYRPGGYDIKAASLCFVLIPDVEYRPGDYDIKATSICFVSHSSICFVSHFRYRVQTWWL